MSNQILVPSLGESVTEATVSKWLKQVGEKVDSDEPLVELETDKVNVEVPSPLAGTLSSIKVKEGDTVEVGALLGIVNEGKSSSIKTVKSDTTDQNQQTYIPPETSKKTLNKNLKSLCESVIKNKADLGIAIDPDGDRLAIIDNKGNIFIEENTLVLCVEEFLNKTKTNKPVVTNLSTTSAIEDITEKYNVTVIRSAVGEINVVNKMKNCNYLSPKFMQILQKIHI